jgi:hypothetical protein
VWLDGRPPGLTDKVETWFIGIEDARGSAIGTQIIEGRISEEDTATSQHVAVINEAFTKKYFNNENPIGQYFGRPELGSSRNYKIVGIVQDARYLDFDFDKPISTPFLRAAQPLEVSNERQQPATSPARHHPGRAWRHCIRC